MFSPAGHPALHGGSRSTYTGRLSRTGPARERPCIRSGSGVMSCCGGIISPVRWAKPLSPREGRARRLQAPDGRRKPCTASPYTQTAHAQSVHGPRVPTHPTYGPPNRASAEAPGRKRRIVRSGAGGPVVASSVRRITFGRSIDAAIFQGEARHGEPFIAPHGARIAPAMADNLPVVPLQSPRELKARIEAERAGAPFLLYRDGSGRQQIFTFGEHAELERIGHDWTVSDDGLSRNGTHVNGERIVGKRRLRDGDVVRFGHTLATFHHPLAASGAETK